MRQIAYQMADRWGSKISRYRFSPRIPIRTTDGERVVCIASVTVVAFIRWVNLTSKIRF